MGINFLACWKLYCLVQVWLSLQSHSHLDSYLLKTSPIMEINIYIHLEQQKTNKAWINFKNHLSVYLINLIHFSYWNTPKCSVACKITFNWLNSRDHTKRQMTESERKSSDGLSPWYKMSQCQGFLLGTTCRSLIWYPINVWQHFSEAVRQRPGSHFKNISWPFHGGSNC